MASQPHQETVLTSVPGAPAIAGPDAKTNFAPAEPVSLPVGSGENLDLAGRKSGLDEEDETEDDDVVDEDDDDLDDDLEDDDEDEDDLDDEDEELEDDDNLDDEDEDDEEDEDEDDEDEDEVKPFKKK